MSIEDVSLNPLVAVIVGAIFSGILIPLFMRRWQNYQAQLELKRDLVEKISNAVTMLVTKLEFIERTKEKLDVDKRKELEQAELEWHEKCSSVGSHIQAYFQKPKVKITCHWDHYADLINSFYLLTGSSEDERGEKVTNIRKNIDEIRKDIDKIKKETTTKQTGKTEEPTNELIDSINWEILSYKPSDSHKVYVEEWVKLKKFIFDYKHTLMKEIINSKISGLSSFF